MTCDNPTPEAAGLRGEPLEWIGETYAKQQGHFKTFLEMLTRHFPAVPSLAFEVTSPEIFRFAGVRHQIKTVFMRHPDGAKVRHLTLITVDAAPGESCEPASRVALQGALLFDESGTVYAPGVKPNECGAACPYLIATGHTLAADGEVAAAVFRLLVSRR